jgi:hypothetical protein
VGGGRDLLDQPQRAQRGVRRARLVGPRLRRRAPRAVLQGGAGPRAGARRADRRPCGLGLDVPEPELALVVNGGEIVATRSATASRRARSRARTRSSRPKPPLSLIEFPADDPARARQFWVTSWTLNWRIAGQEREKAGRRTRARPRLASMLVDATRRFLLVAVLRRPRRRRGTGAGRGARRQRDPSRRDVGDLQGLRGKPVRARAVARRGLIGPG